MSRFIIFHFPLQEKDQSKLSRDQMKLTRKVAFLLASALSGKSTLPEMSLLKLVQVCIVKWIDKSIAFIFDFTLSMMVSVSI